MIIVGKTVGINRFKMNFYLGRLKHSNIYIKHVLFANYNKNVAKHDKKMISTK